MSKDNSATAGAVPFDSQHTPTPWAAIRSPKQVTIVAYDKQLGSKVIATLHVADIEANAAFIVKAANCHDNLLAALKDAHGYVLAMAFNTGDRKKKENYYGAVRRIEAVLARVDRKASAPEASARSQSDGASPKTPGDPT